MRARTGTLARRALTFANKGLEPLNLCLDTRTKRRLEHKRLRCLAENRHFAEPVFPVPVGFRRALDSDLFDEVSQHAERFQAFEDESLNDVGYTLNNPYFSSPDAEVLYTMVRKHRPATVIEVGSGNSTRIIRQAILDGALNTQMMAIDPSPRVDVTGLVDQLHRKPVERVPVSELCGSLKAGDILFIDSSHTIQMGNDVVFLYLQLLPELPPGVLIHIHDIFLPYEYPQEWLTEKHWNWNEQYLVQSLLMFSGAFEVLWAGYFSQRCREDFSSWFPQLQDRRAQSLWLRKKQ